jgi:hypothetical protein
MPSISLDIAVPILSQRAEQLKQAIITAADIEVSLANECLVKNWLGECAISVVYGDSWTWLVWAEG